VIAVIGKTKLGTFTAKDASGAKDMTQKSIAADKRGWSAISRKSWPRINANLDELQKPNTYHEAAEARRKKCRR